MMMTTWWNDWDKDRRMVEWGRQGKGDKEGKEISVAWDKERDREGDGMRRGRILQRSTPT